MPHEGMVDALHNIWRALRQDGVLIDLRPVSGRCPIEVVTATESRQIGELDATGMSADDAAADRAMHEAVDHGWFSPMQTQRFDFAFWWDTVDEMSTFLSDSRRAKGVTPSYSVMTEAHQRMAAERGGAVRLRSFRLTALSSYAKATAAPAA